MTFVTGQKGVLANSAAAPGLFYAIFYTASAELWPDGDVFLAAYAINPMGELSVPISLAVNPFRLRTSITASGCVDSYGQPHDLRALRSWPSSHAVIKVQCQRRRRAKRLCDVSTSCACGA